MQEEKTKKCKHCKTEIPQDAKVCHACGKKQGGGCLSKIIIAVAVLFVIGFLFGDDDEPKTDYSNVETENGSEELAFEKTEVYNGHGVTISIDGIEDKSSEVDISFLVENNSKKDYGISAHSYAVNGLMAGDSKYLSNVDVPAGKKGNFDISIEKDFLESNGIEQIGRLDVIFWAYYDDFKEWNSDVIKIKTNAYDKEKMYKPTGEEVYSDDNMTLWLVGKEDNEYNFVVKNKSSYNVEYYIENCSVDGWSYENDNYLLDLYAEPIHGKTYYAYEFEIDDTFMEENKIEEIKNLEFNLLMQDGYIEDYLNIWEAKSDKIVIE